MYNPEDTDNQNTQDTTPNSQANLPRQYHETDPFNTNTPPNTSASEKAQLDTNGVPPKKHSPRRQSIIIASMLTLAALAAGMGFYFFGQPLVDRELDTTTNLELPEEDSGLLADDLDISLNTMPEALDELAGLFTERYSGFEVVEREDGDNRQRQGLLFYSGVHDGFVHPGSIADDTWSVYMKKDIDPTDLLHGEAEQEESVSRKMLEALREKTISYREVIEYQFSSSGFANINLMEQMLSQYDHYDDGDIFYSINPLVADDIMCVIENHPAHWSWVNSGSPGVESLSERDFRVLSRISIDIHCAPIASVDAVAKEQLPFRRAVSAYLGRSPDRPDTDITLSGWDFGFDVLYYYDDYPRSWGEVPTSLEERRYAEEGYEYVSFSSGSLGPTGVTCSLYRKPGGPWTVGYCGQSPPKCDEITDIDAQKAFYDQICFDDDGMTLIGEYYNF